MSTVPVTPISETHSAWISFLVAKAKAAWMDVEEAVGYIEEGAAVAEKYTPEAAELAETAEMLSGNPGAAAITAGVAVGVEAGEAAISGTAVTPSGIVQAVGQVKGAIATVEAAVKSTPTVATTVVVATPNPVPAAS